VLSFGTGPLVLAALRRQLPEQERPFRVPGGDVIPFLAFYASNLIVYWAAWETNWKLFVAVLLGYVVLVAFQRLRREPGPAMEWRAGSWLVPWLVGLAVLSLLSGYGDGLGVIPFGWSFVVILAFSAAIYALAVRLRMVPEAVVDSVRSTPGDEPDALTA
jgi:amino acid transporter